MRPFPSKGSTGATGPAPSGGTDGQVVTRVSGLPAWADAAGGGTHTSGTLAALPPTPVAGDTYAVTSGTQTGARYTCFVTGTWEGSLPFTSGHSWERPAAATAGGGARWLDTDTGVIYTSSGDATIGWYVELGILGGDRAAVNVLGGSVSKASSDLSSLTLGACTVAILLRWDGGATAYEGMFGVGAPSTANHGINAYYKVNGSNVDLITFQNGAETVLQASINPSAGLHCLAIAPVAGNIWRWSHDGSAIANTAMAASYGAPSSTAPLYIGRDGGGTNDFHGALCDFAIWQSTLSNANIVALATPSTATYRLPITSGMGAPWFRAEANRFDPRFPTVLPAKMGSSPVALVATGIVKTEY